MSHTPTVTLQFNQAIVQACDRLGVHLPARVLTSMRDPPARVPLSAQDELWTAVEAAQDDPLIGLRIGFEIQVGHLDSVGLLLMSSENLGDALRALLEYFPIIGEGSAFKVESNHDSVCIRYLPRYKVCQGTRAEAVVGCIVNLARWMTGMNLAPAQVTLRHAARTEGSDYESVLGCPVRFGADHYTLQYREHDLDAPLIQANPTLRKHLQHVSDQMLAALAESALFSQVQALIHQHPRAGRERIAELVGISGRHLNRRLADEGSSFKLVRDATLQQMAVERLRGKDSPAAVAAALGYSDESAFAKAFRRWSGMSPVQYRKQSTAPL